MKQGLLSLATLLLSLGLLAAMPAPGTQQPSPSDRNVISAEAFLPSPLNAALDNEASSEEAPEDYTLSAAYPNPFRTRTRLELSVSETQKVTVEVYNILGQRVRSLFEGELEADRPRSFSFQAKSLPAGIYLLRVQGETFTATRRAMLVR